jgi:hypothetical protein
MVFPLPEVVAERVSVASGNVIPRQLVILTAAVSDLD